MLFRVNCMTPPFFMMFNVESGLRSQLTSLNQAILWPCGEGLSKTRKKSVPIGTYGATRHKP